MDTKFFTQMCLRHIWVKNLVFIFFLIIQKKYGKAPLSTAVHLLEDVSPLTGSAVSRKPTTVVIESTVSSHKQFPHHPHSCEQGVCELEASACEEAEECSPCRVQRGFFLLSAYQLPNQCTDKRPEYYSQQP